MPRVPGVQEAHAAPCQQRAAAVARDQSQRIIIPCTAVLAQPFAIGHHRPSGSSRAAALRAHWQPLAVPVGCG